MLQVLGTICAALVFVLPSAYADPAKDQIIFIGDSHSAGEFGARINTWLRLRSQTAFEFFASGGSAPLQWRNGIFTSKCATQDRSVLFMQPKKACRVLRTPKFETLFGVELPAPFRSTTSIIALGSNISPLPENRSNEIKWAKLLLHDVTLKHSNCIWIGPPQMPKYTDAEIESRYSIIRSAIELEAAESGTKPCALIDSRAISHYPESKIDPTVQPLGVHYDIPGVVYVEGVQAASLWAEQTILLIEDLLSPPLR